MFERCYHGFTILTNGGAQKRSVALAHRTRRNRQASDVCRRKAWGLLVPE